MQNDNPLIKITGLWLEQGQPQNKGGVKLAKVDNQKWEMELQAGGCTLARLWPGKEGGKAYATGSFLGARCVVFKNTDKKFPDGPDYDVLVSKNEKRDQGGGGFSGGGGGVPGNDNGSDDVPW